jgi:soluble lytic murein transglycosylase-like protein
VRRLLIKSITICAILLAAIIADAVPLYATAARRCALDPKLLQAIFEVESRQNHNAINRQSLDYGIGQINIKTIKAYKFNRAALLTDRQYSIDAAVQVLCDLKKTYASVEPFTWYCRYNVGTGHLTTVHDSCIRYYRKVKVAYENNN